MNDLSTLEVIILISLNKNKGSYAVFSLFKKMKTPMANFIKALSSLRKNGLIRMTEDKIFLEADGLRRLSLNRSRSTHSLMAAVPQHMTRPFSISVDTPYIPALPRLDKSLFPTSPDGTITREGGQ